MERHAAEECIRAALARDDPVAVELIWDRYSTDLFAMLQALLGSRHDAEDVLQAVFVRIVRNRRQVAKARRLDAYVYRMARNEAISFLRRRSGSRVCLDAERWLLPVEDDDRSHELAEELQKALARLPESQREVLLLKIYRDKTFQEIGELVNVSQNTAASRYRYALEKLRTMLRDLVS
mgnify:CR=1 FL=1